MAGRGAGAAGAVLNAEEWKKRIRDAFQLFEHKEGSNETVERCARAPLPNPRLLEPRTEPFTLRFSRFQESGGGGEGARAPPPTPRDTGGTASRIHTVPQCMMDAMPVPLPKDPSGTGASISHGGKVGGCGKDLIFSTHFIEDLDKILFNLSSINIVWFTSWGPGYPCPCSLFCIMWRAAIL